MPEALPSVPSSNALETIGYMLWMMIEPLVVTLQTYDPWIVGALALILAFIPPSRRFTPLKVLTASLGAYAVYVLSPVTYQLTPVWPDPLEADTYIRLGLMLIEAALIMVIIHRLIDAAKGIGGFKTARHALTAHIPTPSALSFSASEMADKMSLNFTPRVLTPVSHAFTHTLSVPVKRA